jgi:hypothetical protein
MLISTPKAPMVVPQGPATDASLNRYWPRYSAEQEVVEKQLQR